MILFPSQTSFYKEVPCRQFSLRMPAFGQQEPAGVRHRIYLPDANRKDLLHRLSQPLPCWADSRPSTVLPVPSASRFLRQTARDLPVRNWEAAHIRKEITDSPFLSPIRNHPGEQGSIFFSRAAGVKFSLIPDDSLYTQRD